MESDYNPSKTKRKRMIKQREAHIIWSLDLTDRCLILAQSQSEKTDPVVAKELIETLKKLRKELSKL